jgi:prepilin-type N-terminal cleavage/methylation domain-containing protein
MVSRHLPVGPHGLSLTELLVVIGLLSLLTASAAPYFLGAWQSLRLRAGAQQLATIVSHARQLAIAQNRQACVRPAGQIVQVLVGTSTPCSTGAAWTGAGTDAAGRIRLTEGVRVSAATANVVFNYLGAAVSPGTYTISDSDGSRTRSVVVAMSGRVSIR